MASATMNHTVYPAIPVSPESILPFSGLRAYGLTLALAYVLFAVYRSTLSSMAKFPPGPRGLPFLGNIFQLDEENWKTFTKWKEQYGPIVGLNFAGQKVVLLNTHTVAADLLDRRAGIYSDRPRWIMASEILTGGLLVVFTGYGEIWRRMRRVAHEGLHMGVAKNYFEIQTKEAVGLAHGLLTDGGNDWEGHLKRSAASLILSVVYDAPPLHDTSHPLIVRINDLAQRLVHAGYPGNFMVEFFPWMKKLPNWMAPWKAKGEAHHRSDSIMLEGYYNSVKDRVLAGDRRPSFAASLALTQERSGFSDRQAAWVAGTMISAGGETTAAVMAWFMLAMVLYPEAQKRAHEELDKVVGRDRLPTMDDLEHMPYLRAMVKETLRWRPVDPMGLQHRSIEDDWYNGHFIPKGTILISNVWAMNRDPNVYGLDYDEFNPSRHLGPDGQLAPAPADTKEEGHVTYGFGRRICVGRHVANNSLFIDIACILWAMNIEMGADENGHLVIPTQDKSFNEGLVVRPESFPLKAKERFHGARETLEYNMEEMKSRDNEARHEL